MRGVALFFLALFAVICLSAFVLIHCIDLTVLNEEYVIGKIEEQQLYEQFIDSMSNEQGLGIDAKAFVEIIGMDTVKSSVNGIISGILSYLKDPSVQKIEVGLPKGIFPMETTISLDAVLGEEELGFLQQAKWAVQIMLLLRSVALLLALACLALIIIIAKGIASKIRWVGFPLAFSGIIVIVLSLIAQGLLGSMVNSELSVQMGSAAGLVSFIESLFSGYASLVQFYGIILLIAGIAAVFLSFLLLPKLLKGRKKTALEEKKKIAEKREETELKEKGNL